MSIRNDFNTICLTKQFKYQQNRHQFLTDKRSIRNECLTFQSWADTSHPSSHYCAKFGFKCGTRMGARWGGGEAPKGNLILSFSKTESGVNLIDQFSLRVPFNKKMTFWEMVHVRQSDNDKYKTFTVLFY